MADKLGLDYDEVVILQETNVAHGGVMAGYTDELILTNKKIICIHMGIFGGKKTTYHYPLEQIKVYNGMPQAQFGKLSNGNKTLSIFFLNGEEQFFFQSSNNKTIEKWISEIQKLFGCEVKNSTKEKNNKKKSKYEIEDDSILGAFKEVGNGFKEVGLGFAEAFGIKRKSDEPNEAISDLSTNNGTGAKDNKVCQYCGKALPLSAVFCTNCGTKYQQTEKKVVDNNRICRNCGSKIAVGLNFCTECGSAVEVKTNVPTADDDKNPESSAESKNEIPREKLSIDQQIELLQKLKALVDAGVLSQEEFEKKKKEIL